MFKAGYCAADIAQWASKFPMPVYFAYESGCSGTALARNLRELGYACDVIAVSTLSFSTKDKQRKCDKVDAGVILKAITQKNPEYSCVWIPTIEQDGLRELYRAFESAKDEVKRSKQQLSSFLLRQGIVWNELTKTGNLKKPLMDKPLSSGLVLYRLKIQICSIPIFLILSVSVLLSVNSKNSKCG